MKRVLVYPCGTEIGLEIYRALKNSIKYELIGGSSSYDHGRFVYEKHIDNLPFITDKSTEQDICEFNKAILQYDIDMIYPAMDGVVTVFSKYKELLNSVVIGPEYETAKITRSKRLTYMIFDKVISVPKMYSMEEAKLGKLNYPVFVKPDVGQGSAGAVVINCLEELVSIKKADDTQLILEYLPGEEYTVDCFTNFEGELIYCKGRTRKRVKNGISVNAFFVERPEFIEFAKKINARLNQRGGWFFQLKESVSGELKLLEIASRIAGTSAITRNIGVNLPLLTANIFNNIECKDVIINDYEIELDRALENKYKVNIDYDTVYVDYDDTIVVKERLNLPVIKFLFQCLNNKKKLVLLSKHDGDLQRELSGHRILDLFDEIIHISREDEKRNYIVDKKAIFIDDSYGERKAVYEKHGISVFDINMLECLMEE